MNDRILCTLIALLTIIVGSRPSPAGEAPQASTSGGITEITLQRTWCFGSCPIDQLLLRADGTAEYTGMENSRLTGQFTGRLSTWDFDQLSRWLVAEGYFGMSDSYGRNNADAPSSVVRVTRGGERKSVINYARESLDLWGMEKAISAVAADTQWQPASSGIRIQILWKDQGGNWLPRSGWPVWVTPEKQGFTPSGTRERYVVSTDGDGSFAISLAPGTYNVSDGFGNSTATQVIVERDKFTEASVRLESAITPSLKADSPQAPTPPPPGDGLYRIAGRTPAVWLYQGSETITLGEKVETTIQDKQIWSDSKDNTTFRLGLAIPYDPVVNRFSHVLIVNGKAYRQEGLGSRSRETLRLFFPIVGDEDAWQVAQHFKTPRHFFRDPGYQVHVSMSPTRTSFGRGDEVTATLQIHNPGTKAVDFSSQSMRVQRHDYYTLTARSNDQPVTDISFSGNRGGRVYPWDLQPGATFTEEKVRLNEWFEFREPGIYDIHAVFRLDFSDSTSGSWLPISWTDTDETDFTVVID